MFNTGGQNGSGSLSPQSTELEALGTDLLEEEEMPSYLKDTTALPDFVDEAPVDAEIVGPGLRSFMMTLTLRVAQNTPQAEVAR